MKISPYFVTVILTGWSFLLLDIEFSQEDIYIYNGHISIIPEKLFAEEHNFLRSKLERKKIWTYQWQDIGSLVFCNHLPLTIIYFKNNMCSNMCSVSAYIVNTMRILLHTPWVQRCADCKFWSCNLTPSQET